MIYLGMLVTPGCLFACVPCADCGINNDTSRIFNELKLNAQDMKTGSGVFSLECGGKSLAARLWLFEKARRSIDIQYYSFARNITGLIACQYLVSAADRGVKVRLLIDEASSRMNEYEVKVLDAHENIEIRVYNAGLKVGRADKRLKKLIANRNRLLYRMHNKTLVVDREAAMTGGRNISDEYFDVDDKFNFRDRDVLLLGQAAAAAGGSFDAFWNDGLSVPVEKLTAKKKAYDPRQLFDKMNKLLNDTSTYGPLFRNYVNAFLREIERARRDGRFMTLARVTFVSDPPGKNEERPDRKGSVTTDTIMALIRSARHTVDIQTPYFITLDEGKRLLSETVARGVRVRILSNSLASIDNVEAFDAYQRDRKEHLATGIEMYEYRPDPSTRFDLTIPETQGKLQYKPVFGLHSKTLIVDGRVTVIGSYNFDPMSANRNTECIAVIRSKDYAEEMSKVVEEEFHPGNSWRVTDNFNPDKEAPVLKRIKSATKRIYPKSLL
jgi:cardiolipin synthase C